MAAAAALLLTVAPGCGREASAERAEPKIVFSRGSDLYLVSMDGSQERMLAPDAGEAAVSPDGQWLAFVRRDGIWTMSRDGRDPRALTRGNRDLAPAWSHDGRTIYFSRYLPGKDEYGGFEFATAIFRIRANGSDLERLTNPERSDHGTCHDGAAPSPDGSVIAYSDIGECDHGFDVSISAIDTRGRPASLDRFDGVGYGLDPAWSPDAGALAFVAVDEWGENLGLRIAHDDGSAAIVVDRRWSTEPAWSLDGQRIAFVRRDSTGDIWLARNDGTDVHAITSTRADERGPAWLPAAEG